MTTSYLQPNMKHDELEFLERRERLKESIRKKTQNGNNVALTSESSEPRKQKLPFGSFFGPSQPAIASRVLQTSKSLLENEQSRAKNSSSGLETEPVKNKAEKLKDSRDYSFLSSDDAELPISKPSPKENQMDHPRPVSSSNSKCSSTKNQARTKEEPRKLSSKNGQSSSRLATRRLDSVEQRRVEERKVTQEMVPRKVQPMKQSTQQLHKKKKRPERRSEEDEMALQMVREICGSDRYVGRGFDDYDDKNMEASFEDISKEERRSERLGKKEDAEQLRLIEEEERRERLKKKKQKLSHKN